MVVVDVDHQRAQHVLQARLHFGLKLLHLARLDVVRNIVVGVEALLRGLEPCADAGGDAVGVGVAGIVAGVAVLRAVRRVLAGHGYAWWDG
ncbi:hypothetical protein D3C72_2127730 [compost metagenome]